MKVSDKFENLRLKGSTPVKFIEEARSYVYKILLKCSLCVLGNDNYIKIRFLIPLEIMTRKIALRVHWIGIRFNSSVHNFRQPDVHTALAMLSFKFIHRNVATAQWLTKQLPRSAPNTFLLRFDNFEHCSSGCGFDFNNKQRGALKILQLSIAKVMSSYTSLSAEIGRRLEYPNFLGLFPIFFSAPSPCYYENACYNDILS